MSRSIETVHASGVVMRSRLEARWAYFFDACGWSWSYEPIDLDGYIPDFILYGKEPILIEVKPALSVKELHTFTTKIERSGWDKEALIVGADLIQCKNECCIYLGLLAERGGDMSWDWNTATTCFCGNGRLGFRHSSGSYLCRFCGVYTKMYGKNNDLFIRNWIEAGNKVQWRPSGLTQNKLD